MADQIVPIIKLINGDDIVCSFPREQLTEKSPLLRILKPLHVKYVPQLTPNGFKDYVALIKWTPYTKDQVISIPKDKIMTITNAGTEMIKSYHHVARKYDDDTKVPEKVNAVDFKKQRFTDKENEKINEIFDEFDLPDDEPDTIH